jgi:hypothetical protein
LAIANRLFRVTLLASSQALARIEPARAELYTYEMRFIGVIIVKDVTCVKVT